MTKVDFRFEMMLVALENNKFVQSSDFVWGTFQTHEVPQAVEN
jgi:hypothetical protein